MTTPANPRYDKQHGCPVCGKPRPVNNRIGGRFPFGRALPCPEHQDQAEREQAAENRDFAIREAESEPF